MLRLHFNKSNGIFSIRREDRSTLSASERRAKIPFVGDVVSLAPRVHLLITRGAFEEATLGSRPFLPTVVTRFPKVRLIIKRIKEIIND